MSYVKKRILQNLSRISEHLMTVAPAFSLCFASLYKTQVLIKMSSFNEISIFYFLFYSHCKVLPEIGLEISMHGHKILGTGKKHLTWSRSTRHTTTKHKAWTQSIGHKSTGIRHPLPQIINIYTQDWKVCTAHAGMYVILNLRHAA